MYIMYKNNEESNFTLDNFDLLRCEICDDHLKKRYLDMKEQLFKIFKIYLKIQKFIKNKDEVNLKKCIDEIGYSQKDFIQHRLLLDKLILIKKQIINNPNSVNISIKVDSADEIEKKTLFEELNKKKEYLKKYKKNTNELEIISNRIQESLELISISNTLQNN